VTPADLETSAERYQEAYDNWMQQIQAACRALTESLTSIEQILCLSRAAGLWH
jgi:uncharacterized protein YukE